MSRILSMNRKSTKKSTILTLNDDCLRTVMQKLSREDLSAMCSVNNRVRNVGENIFAKNFGKSLTISKEVLSTDAVTCEAFGDVFNKLIVEFKPSEIAGTLTFVADVERLEIRHLSAGTQGRARRLFEWCSEKIYQRFGIAGEQKLQAFLEGLD